MSTGGINGPNPARRSTPAVSPQVQAAPSRPDGGVSLSGASDLEAALNAAPDIRPEAVTAGAALAADSSYPGPETLRQLSQFLAQNLASAAE